MIRLGAVRDNVSALREHAAGGAQVMVFTTGRGSCFGCKPVPSIKVASNDPTQTDQTRDGKQRVEGISLDVRRGEIFGLLGPNGAGKTTTVNILTTLINPDAGTVRVAGHDVTRDRRAIRLLAIEP